MEKKLHKSKMWDQKNQYNNFEPKNHVLFWTQFMMDDEASIPDSKFPGWASDKTQKPKT